MAEILPPLRGRDVVPSSDGAGTARDKLNPRQQPVHLESYRTKLSTAPSQIDYVIVFKPDDDKARSSREFEQLIAAIEAHGLLSTVREGGSEGDVLIFVKCPDTRLIKEVFEARKRDWLAGVRLAIPDFDTAVAREPVTDAERLRLVHLILTAPVEDGGLGLTPKIAPWRRVESLFPLHNKDFDNLWLKRWSTKWLIGDDELEHLNTHFGTKIAFYFAFLQFYLQMLVFPAGLGLYAFFFLREVSALYASLVVTWGVVFIALWQRRELELATRWDVRHCSRQEYRRAAFSPTSSEVDPKLTDQKSLVKYGPFERLAREALTIPFALVCGGFLALVLTFIFCVEVWMGEVYDGPGKQILVFSPTVLFTGLVGPFSGFYMRAAQRLTLYENHETDGKFNASLSRKAFLLNFMTSYTALFLTQYVYLPFGHLIVPKLDVLGITTAYASYGVKAKPFSIDGNRLRNQLFYFAVTAQLVNLAMELVVPMVLRVVKGEAESRLEKYTGKKRHYHPNDAAEEKQLLERVRAEAELPEHNLYTEYAEMTTQYGYTAMWSPIWPLTPLCALINNVVELRADAAKLCKNTRRPVPGRQDTIGPWIDHLQFLTWLGALTTASSVYLLQGDAPSTKPFLHLLAVCFFAEQGYLVVRAAVGVVVGRVPSAADLRAGREERDVRAAYLDRHGHATPTDAEIDALVRAQKLASRIPAAAPDAFFQDASTTATVARGVEILARRKAPDGKDTASSKKEL